MSLLTSSIEFQSSTSPFRCDANGEPISRIEREEVKMEYRRVRYPSQDTESVEARDVPGVVNADHEPDFHASETLQNETYLNSKMIPAPRIFVQNTVPPSPYNSECRKSASGGATETASSSVPFSLPPSSSSVEDVNSINAKDDREKATDDRCYMVNGDVSGYDRDSDGGFDETKDEFPDVPIEHFDTRETDRFGFLGGSGREVAIPVEVFRRRESKWLEMLDNWQLFMTKRFDKVRTRCRKGIPSSLRPRAWKYLCGAQFFMTSSKTKQIFETLDKHPGDPHWNSEIVKDLNRQFPNHELFSQATPYGKFGQEDLFRVLKAWTLLHPEEGYCQAQAPIAAALLMHMPAHEAFYCFAQICQKYLPGYFSAGLEAIQLDGDILFGLLKKHSYPSYKHLKKQNIDPVLYMVEWFMCIFCRTLPWPCVLRVLDMFFCEGVKVLFKVGVFLFKYGLSSREQLRACPSMYDTIERLRHLPIDNLNEEYLVQKVAEMNITDEDLERVHFKQIKVRKKKQKQQQSHVTI